MAWTTNPSSRTSPTLAQLSERKLEFGMQMAQIRCLILSKPTYPQIPLPARLHPIIPPQIDHRPHHNDQTQAADWVAPDKVVENLSLLVATLREVMRIRPTSGTGLERVVPEGGR